MKQNGEDVIQRGKGIVIHRNKTFCIRMNHAGNEPANDVEELRNENAPEKKERCQAALKRSAAVPIGNSR
jgi:hypothetical protein